MKNKVMECSLACREIMQNIPEALACGAVNLQNGRLVTVHHLLEDLTQEDLDLIAGSVLISFRGNKLRLVERLLDQQLGEPPGSYADEVFRSATNTLCFMLAIPKHDLCVFLITRKHVNQGLGWLTLRKAVSKLRRNMTTRIVEHGLFRDPPPSARCRARGMPRASDG